MSRLIRLHPYNRELLVGRWRIPYAPPYGWRHWRPPMARPKRTPEDRARVREGMRQFANSQRDGADYASAYWGVDDPLHPPMLTEEGQPFRDWLDFVEKVARPLVEADGDHDAEQAAMALYRKASPYYLCTALVMAANRVAGR